MTDFFEIENFPEWALPYFVNGDGSGYSAEDVAEMEQWRDANPGVSISGPVDGTENEFEPFPVFGAACGTVTVSASRTE